ncbi:MAG: hypothetical protein M1831_006804 [Alyxoria varia]|nr:MAG: hypothetical protein M1831_006804 [Alyxoria varia]
MSVPTVDTSGMDDSAPKLPWDVLNEILKQTANSPARLSTAHMNPSDSCVGLVRRLLQDRISDPPAITSVGKSIRRMIFCGWLEYPGIRYDGDPFRYCLDEQFTDNVDEILGKGHQGDKQMWICLRAYLEDVAAIAKDNITPKLTTFIYQESLPLLPTVMNTLSCSTIRHLKLEEIYIARDHEIKSKFLLYYADRMSEPTEKEKSISMSLTSFQDPTVSKGAPTQNNYACPRIFCTSLLRLCASSLKYLYWGSSDYSIPKVYWSLDSKLLSRALTFPELRTLTLENLLLEDRSILDACLGNGSRVETLAIYGNTGSRTIHEGGPFSTKSIWQNRSPYIDLLLNRGYVDGLRTLTLDAPLPKDFPLGFLIQNAQLERFATICRADLFWLQSQQRHLSGAIIEASLLISTAAEICISLKALRIDWLPTVPSSDLLTNISQITTLEELVLDCRTRVPYHEDIIRGLRGCVPLKRIAFRDDIYTDQWKIRRLDVDMWNSSKGMLYYNARRVVPSNNEEQDMYDYIIAHSPHPTDEDLLLDVPPPAQTDNSVAENLFFQWRHERVMLEIAKDYFHAFPGLKLLGVGRTFWTNENQQLKPVAIDNTFRLKNEDAEHINHDIINRLGRDFENEFERHFQITKDPFG